MGSTQRCCNAPNMEDMGVKNTSRTRFPLKLRMPGVDPGASRQCFGVAWAELGFYDGWYRVELAYLL